MTNQDSWNSFKMVFLINKKDYLKKSYRLLILIGIITLFLPWTQNISLKGKVTTLYPEDRPQYLNSIIPGYIKKWYFKEGDLIKQGDTVLQIGEMKEDYMDTSLLTRTREQILAKIRSKENYIAKATTYDSQIKTLKNALDIKQSLLQNKLRQQKGYIEADSSNLQTGLVELNIYQRQSNAGETLFQNGTISLTELEKRKANYQNAQAKVQSLKNKLFQSRSDYQNILFELDQIAQEYKEKIIGKEGDQLNALSSQATIEYELAKLNNSLSNYTQRQTYYYIISPIEGQLGAITKSGKDMIVKEGEKIAEIIPNIRQRAIEIYIKPMDRPLIHEKTKVQFNFDGYPAIVFTGWPSFNYGTFTGKIKMIENAATHEGKFRALVVEDPDSRPWPPGLSVGNGAKGIALLSDVPIYYELWRYINGFPPNYYTSTDIEIKSKEKD